jgi:hypothetical protein
MDIFCLIDPGTLIVTRQAQSAANRQAGQRAGQLT